MRCHIVRSRRFRVADLKVLLHSRVRCCVRCCHRNAARCSLGLVPLFRSQRLLCMGLRRVPDSSHPSRKRATPGRIRAEWTREGGICDWRPPAVHPAFRRHLTPGGQGGRISQVQRVRRVGGPLPPRVPWSPAEAVPSGAFRWMAGRASRPGHRGGVVVARPNRSSVPCGRPRGGGPPAGRDRSCRNNSSSEVAKRVPSEILYPDPTGVGRSKRRPEWSLWPDLFLAGAWKRPGGPLEPDLQAKCLGPGV
jgi:hypothetical protein